MEIIKHEALSRCIRDAVRAELQEHFKTGGRPPQDERLFGYSGAIDHLVPE
jgi:hypothetical protein